MFRAAESASSPTNLWKWGGYYNTRIQIWTKEVIDAVIEIVRKQKMEDGTDKYGATFIGMSDTDAIKIDIYQVFREA